MPKPTRYPVSDHCDGRVFFNPGNPQMRGLPDIARWKLTSRSTPWPRSVALTPSPQPALVANAVRATWINHATFLLETPQGNFLTDPVFSRCCGLFGQLGPPRVHPPGLAFQDLPVIHFVLLSHDHYDHCDLPTLRQLAQAHEPLALTPLGNGDLLTRAGFTRIIELDWWQNHTITPNLSLTVTPAQHWSNRLTRPRNGRLWGGFFINAGPLRLYFAGDSGYHDSLFKDIGRRLGPPDLALLPIGAYEPRWFMHIHHCNPAEAVQIHRDLGAHVSAAMHWGTFQLTDEGRNEPPQALKIALQKAGLTLDDFRVLEPGGALIVPSKPTTHSSVKSSAIESS